MKFLPDEPPDSVPGRVAQGGAAGPFLRGGRPPVDPRRPAAVQRRAAFSRGPKVYRFGDSMLRTDWDASSAAGTTGARKIASAAVLTSMSAAADAPAPPSSVPIGVPEISTCSPVAPDSIPFVLVPPSVSSWQVWLRLGLQNAGGYVHARQFTPWILVWDGAQILFDAGALYLRSFTPLVAGHQVTTELRNQNGGVWGPTIGEQFWTIS